jgi:hypothetical protein
VFELDEYVRPANTEVVDGDQAKRKDPLEVASSEAEAANRSIDERDPDFQQAQVTEKKDRLGIVRDDPQMTTWVHDIKREKEMAIEDAAREKKEPQKPAKPEPKYPFNDADPIFAYYGNDKRSLLFFVLRHPDGPQGQPGPTETHQIHNTSEHKEAWYWIHKLIGQEAINKNTNKEIDRVNRERKKHEVEAKDQKHKAEQEELFQAKITAFEMDVIRQTTHRELKSKIRRAKNILELTAYVGAIIALEYKDESKPN